MARKIYKKNYRSMKKKRTNVAMYRNPTSSMGGLNRTYTAIVVYNCNYAVSSTNH